jgi:hypothetical protein
MAQFFTRHKDSLFCFFQWPICFVPPLLGCSELSHRLAGRKVRPLRFALLGLSFSFCILLKTINLRLKHLCQQRVGWLFMVLLQCYFCYGAPNMALKGTCRLKAVLKFSNLSSFGASFSVRERHAP